jgi:GNAT superfamily N-acetyltransferase
MKGMEVVRRKLVRDDAPQVASLIAEVYEEFCRDEANPTSLDQFVRGMKRSAQDPDRAYGKIAKPIMLVAVYRDEIVGVIMGEPNRIKQLFVRGSFHRLGIAAKLVERFERRARALGATDIRVRSSPYAEPFYSRQGFRKTTGIRTYHGMRNYPMCRFGMAICLPARNHQHPTHSQLTWCSPQITV